MLAGRWGWLKIVSLSLALPAAVDSLDHAVQERLRQHHDPRLQTGIQARIWSLAVGTSHAATTKKSTTRHASMSMRPKITESAARAIAQAKVPHGTVKSHELERESGHLIYSYDFVVPGKSGIDEVNIDAMNGAVIAVTHEGPKAERKELAKEKREASAPSTAH